MSKIHNCTSLLRTLLLNTKLHKALIYQVIDLGVLPIESRAVPCPFEISSILHVCTPTQSIL
jgi:hypothetical protein